MTDTEFSNFALDIYDEVNRRQLNEVWRAGNSTMAIMRARIDFIFICMIVLISDSYVESYIRHESHVRFYCVNVKQRMLNEISRLVFSS
jgi:hypothetical protein